MPSRRAQQPHKQLQPAAQLPAGRLPVGTHLPSPSPPPPRSSTDRSTPCSARRRSRCTSVETGSGTDALAKPAPSKIESPLHMSTAPSSDCTGSAEAKLRRQQQRIDMDAALTVPDATSSRPHPRGKEARVKMPIDWNISDKVILGPATEVRVNTFYRHRPSRATCFRRSISGLSEQTAGTDTGRHYSRIDHGYQRSRTKKQEALTPFDEKPVEKQKTVEASFDKREIYKVFAGELPTLDFIQANPGVRNGQLQFIQHPNGDVSAHMWSAVRFEWENIGCFSNIRKRIEGQVANDRLRGETAGQALRRNTLAYFRTAAKQKEQTTMGYTFGQAEIQHLMPQPQDQPSSGAEKAGENSQTAPSLHVTTPSAAPVPTVPSAQSCSSASCLTDHEPIELVLHQQSAIGSQPRFVLTLPGEKPPDFTLHSSQQLPGESDDPFTSDDSFAASCGPAGVVSAAPSSPIVSRDEGGTTHQSAGRVPSGGIPGVVRALAGPGTPSQAKATTPMLSREAMRNQLFKLGESAKERSLNQANARTGRTVMRDPFTGQPIDKEEFPSLTQSNTATSPATSVRATFCAPHSRLLERGPTGSPLAWQDSQSPPTGCLATELQRECSLGESVPDTDNPRTEATSGKQVNMSISDPQPPHVKKSDKMLEQELSDWWYSGKKVLRQEEFYQSVVAASTPARPHLITPFARPRPEATWAMAAAGTSSTPPSPEAFRDTPPFNEAMTRIFIPVYENLASYVQGPPEKRRDYWCNWSKPPEYALDRSPAGNSSFFEEEWGKPPARIGRDPRYARLPPGDLRFAAASPGYSPGGAMAGSPVPGNGGATALSGASPGHGSGGRLTLGGKGRFIFDGI